MPARAGLLMPIPKILVFPGSTRAGSHNVRLAAVRRLACEAADAGLLSSELAAGIRRVKGVKKLGVQPGNWLSATEARELRQSPNAASVKGKRDRAIIAVLLGCRLRRRELADIGGAAEGHLLAAAFL